MKMQRNHFLHFNSNEATHELKLVNYNELTPAILYSLSKDGFELNDEIDFIYENHLKYADHAFFQKPVLFSCTNDEINNLPSFIKKIETFYVNERGIYDNGEMVNNVRCEARDCIFYLNHRWNIYNMKFDDNEWLIKSVDSFPLMP